MAIDDLRQKLQKIQENEHKVENMRQSLMSSRNSDGILVEKEATFFGDETKFRVVDNTGAKTEVKIKDDGNLLVKGERKDFASYIEKGEKLPTQSAYAGSQTKNRQLAYQKIDESILSAEEKMLLKEKVEKTNFAEQGSSPEKKLENLTQAISEQSKQKTSKAENLAKVQKIKEHRGIEESQTQKRTPPAARTQTKTSQIKRKETRSR